MCIVMYCIASACSSCLFCGGVFVSVLFCVCYSDLCWLFYICGVRVVVVVGVVVLCCGVVWCGVVWCGVPGCVWSCVGVFGLLVVVVF